jgi:hypothetical protein
MVTGPADSEVKSPSRPSAPANDDRATSEASARRGREQPKRFGTALLRQMGRRGRAGAADYVYQIVIVIIGVFLGITFESMASERDRTQKAHAALDQLVADLRRDDADMDRIAGQQRGQERDFGEIATWLANSPEAGSTRIDSLLEKVVTSLTVYPRRGAYTSMIASGQIALLPRDLASSIVNLYENVYSRLSANGEHYDYSLERDFLPSYANSWDPIRHGLIATDPAERVRFRNHLLLMRAWSAYYIDLVAQSQAAVKRVIADIERVRRVGE